MKKATVSNHYGDTVHFLYVLEDQDWAVIIGITQGIQTRIEIYPRMMKEGAEKLLEKELARYDYLGIAAMGRVVELVEVAE